MRATQSLVQICADCWKRPAILGWELLWRWSFAIPAIALLYRQGSRMTAGVSLNSLSLSDPAAAGQQLAAATEALSPAISHAVLWLGPLLAVAWSVASGLGRNTVLRRLDPALRPAPVTLIALQLLRIAALAAVCGAWFRAIHWAADTSLGGAEPNLVGYSAWVICLTLGIFVLWALLSWIFSIAPLLAMVFSAIPLPFEADMTGAALYAWWAVVTLLYLVASDFFQVARLAAFIQFWRTYQPG